MSFQDELHKASRTPEEAERSVRDEEYNEGSEIATVDYERIKKELLEMANSGKYKMVDGKKQITLYYKNPGIKHDFKYNEMGVTVNKTLLNPKGKYAKKVYYTLLKRAHYEGYMDKLKKLGAADHIQVRAVGLYSYMKKETQVFSLEGGLIGHAIIPSEISVCIECITEY